MEMVIALLLNFSVDNCPTETISQQGNYKLL